MVDNLYNDASHMDSSWKVHKDIKPSAVWEASLCTNLVSLAILLRCSFSNSFLIESVIFLSIFLNYMTTFHIKFI